MVQTTPMIFDGHNDTLLNLYFPERGKGRSFFERSTTGHIDLPRARDVGFGGGFFAILAPSQKQANVFDDYRIEGGYHLPLPSELDPHEASRMTMDMMALMFQLERQSESALQVVRSVADIERCLSTGVIASLLHLEGAEAIDPNLNALEVFYQAGLRSLGLVWSRPNRFGHGVPLKFPSSPDTGPGLTDAGKALVRACNQLEIMVDVSHLTEKGFWDVAAVSDAPIVATHSNVHRLCPHARNLTDKQLDAIRETGGMVGVNFGVGFLRDDGEWDANTPIEVVVRHIDYLVDRLGIDHVGFGSDMDGVKLPNAIADVTGFAVLIDALQAAGYDEVSLTKLCHENWLRLLEKTLTD